MLDPDPPNYERIEIGQYRLNASEFRNQLAGNNKGAMQKVKTFVKNFGYDYPTVEDKIYKDDLFACCFAKIPGKQGIHEKTAGNYLRQFTELENFRKLSPNGKNSMHLTDNGDFVTKSELNNVQNNKSLDFKWNVCNVKFYASHKYIKAVKGGGHQNNQEDDVDRLLQRFRNRRKNHTALFVICDGGYFTDHVMSKLSDSARNKPPLSFVCHVEDVIGLIRKHYRQS